MRIVRLLLVTVAFVAFPTALFAHPLGNFTSNHLVRVSADQKELHVRYVLDNAEIPTFAVLRELDPQSRPTASTLAAWSRAFAQTTRAALDVRADGVPLQLTVEDASARLRPGAGGLSTMYIVVDYRATLAPATRTLAVVDNTFPGKLGWKDVVVGAAAEPTDQLRRYPPTLAGSPRTRTAAQIARAPSGALSLVSATDATATVAAPAITTRSNALSDLLGRDFRNPLVFAIALLVAIGLGALHALEPGHGKTLLAVSLVGARATAGQALTLASSLTLAHTAGVILFGVLVLALSRSIVPETLYPWVALVSGAMVAVIGARALARIIGSRHTHAGIDDEEHARAHAIPGSAPLGFRSALVAATTGNLAPCPAALVVLLAAINTHQIAVGLALIVAFSLGLAGTLTGIGIAVVRSAAWLGSRSQFDGIARFAPLVTAVAMSTIGAWMVGEAFVSQGITISPIAGALLVAIAVLGYAFSALSHRHGGAHAHAHARAVEGTP